MEPVEEQAPWYNQIVWNVDSMIINMFSSQVC